MVTSFQSDSAAKGTYGLGTTEFPAQPHNTNWIAASQVITGLGTLTMAAAPAAYLQAAVTVIATFDTGAGGGVLRYTGIDQNGQAQTEDITQPATAISVSTTKYWRRITAVEVITVGTGNVVIGTDCNSGLMRLKLPFTLRASTDILAAAYGSHMQKTLTNLDYDSSDNSIKIEAHTITSPHHCVITLADSAIGTY